MISKLSLQMQQHAEYLLEGRKKSVQRRRADPKVTLAVILESIVNDIRDTPSARPFLTPVNAKKVSDYYAIIKQPMDIQQIRMKVKTNSYETRKTFLDDFKLILTNSRVYNGDKSEITKQAVQLMEVVTRRVIEKEQKLMKLEKSINPLLDDNDVVGFNFILGNIVQKCRNVPKSFSFHQPVDGKKVKTYYDKIKTPMDLGTMEQKCKKHQYHTVESFLSDVEQIYKNSVTFNGEASIFSQKAKEIFELGKSSVNEEKTKEDLKLYEGNIQKALEAAETESVMTGPSSIAEDVSERPSLEELVPDEETVPYSFSEEPSDIKGGEGGDTDLMVSLRLSGDEDEEAHGEPMDFQELQNQLNLDDEDTIPFAEWEPGEISAEGTEGALASMEKTGQLHADLGIILSCESCDCRP